MRGSAGFSTLVVLLACATSGCATAPQVSGTSHRVITESELASAASTTVYDAIDRLRPAWLGPSGPGPGADVVLPMVYMNRLYLGDSGTLASVRVQDVVEVRLVPPGVARDRYGTRHPAGVIEVVTRDVGAY